MHFVSLDVCLLPMRKLGWADIGKCVIDCNGQSLSISLVTNIILYVHIDIDKQSI